MIYARISEGVVTNVHVVADAVEDGPGLLSDLWGGDPSEYVKAPDPDDPAYPGMGWLYDGETFTHPATVNPDAVAD